MESPGSLLPRKRKRTSAAHNNPQTSRRNSSSSSDILVAAPTPSSPRPSLPATEEKKSTTMGQFASKTSPPPPSPVTARIEDGRVLVVSFNDASARQAFEEIITTDNFAEAIRGTSINQAADSDEDDPDDNPNARGTYSKAYTMKHQEIEWVHRGQGRYLPAAQARATATMQTPESSTRAREVRQSTDRASTRNSNTFAMPDDHPHSVFEFARRRRLNKDGDTFPVPRELDHPSGRPPAHTPASDFWHHMAPSQAHVTRRSSGRIVRVEPEADSPERRSSRFASRRTYNEQDSAGTDDDMEGGKEQTYDKAYAEAHGIEHFYHTGNGWYKRGQRPSKGSKRQDSAGQAASHANDGAFKLEANSTIHSTQLHLFPNVEFHHCGNGWYKPGPDATGHRNSTIIEPSPSAARSSEDAHSSFNGPDLDITVSKAYADEHPEIKWVHRGNGRYRANGYTTPSQVAPADDELEPVTDGKTYSKEYKDAHPHLKFHHRGNARYALGSPPAQWAEKRKQRRTSQVTEGVQPQTKREEEMAPKEGLFDKEWVDAHPDEEYHHRGQGRWARGPRPPPRTSIPSVPQSALDEPEESEAEDPDELVPTTYVDAHPNETFHHRGQGRWARGLPPIGSNAKTAIRGPGAKVRPSASTSQAEEDEESKAPPPNALLVKEEGPKKFPQYNWHYRGGGKWSRLTKQEAEDLTRRQTGRKLKPRARKSVDGATAQLEREAAAAAYDIDDDEGYEVSGHFSAKPPPRTSKRRRTNNSAAPDSFNNVDDEGILSKQSSQKSASQAPTPKPRIMTEEEDPVTEEDMPPLFRDEWSPPTEELDEADILLRRHFRPMNGPEVFLKAMTKHEPNTRPTSTLVALADHADTILQQLSEEFLELDKITAPHRRVPGKPAKGGTVPIDPLTWEDKKEADLYDYHFDPRKIGEQDPDAQRIQRDAEGRELRGRRNRSAFTNTGTVPGWNFGDEQPLGPRRAVRAPQRFDGVVAPPRKRARNSTTATRGTSQAPSLTPERGVTPMTEPLTLPAANIKGRLVGHVPKRVQELRGESVAASVGPLPAGGSGGGAAGGLAGGMRSKEGSPVRKGRPPGSKNLHKRKDAGIKKGPRKPKVQGAVGGIAGGAGEGFIGVGVGVGAGGAGEIEEGDVSEQKMDVEGGAMDEL